MRAYKIDITNAASGNVTTYSSFDKNGNTMLGALNVEFDIPLYDMDSVKDNGAIIRIWGVSLESIGQSFDLNPINGVATNTIMVYAGMAKGLPLANPQQYGLILEGEIRQSFGNAVGVERSIEFVVTSAAGTANNPKNISWNWPAGQNLSAMIQQSFAVAFPNLKCDININQNLVLNQAEPGFAGNLQQFGSYVREVSKHIMGNNPNYLGVNILIKGNVVKVYDGTVKQEPISIVLQDLIGQPTWIAADTIQFRSVMRSDLAGSNLITMPIPPKNAPTISTINSTAGGFKQASIFQGNFIITAVRHVGNFRQPDGNSWVTVIDAVRETPTIQ